MIDISDIERPSKEIIEKLKKIGSATASGELSRMGIKDPFIQGPVTWTPGKTIAGPAITLQFMPIREDVYHDDEYSDPETQLHRHALYMAKQGDIVVVDARAEMTSGVFGEMMLTFFQGQGGAGVVIDVRVFNRHGIEKDERSLAIERSEIELVQEDKKVERTYLILGRDIEVDFWADFFCASFCC